MKKSSKIFIVVVVVGICLLGMKNMFQSKADIIMKCNDSMYELNTIEEIHNEIELYNKPTGDEVAKILDKSCDSAKEEFLNSERVEAIKILGKFDELIEGNTESKEGINASDDTYCNMAVKEEYFEQGDNTKIVYSACTRYGTIVERELIIENVDETNTKWPWKKVSTWKKASSKAYGNYNLKFQDQSKIGDLRLFKAKSVFKYNISSEGLKAIDIVGYADDGGNCRWKIHPKEYTVEVKKATSVGKSIKGHVTYRFKDVEEFHTDLYKHDMSVVIKSWNKTNKKMETEHSVTEYSKIE